MNTYYLGFDGDSFWVGYLTYDLCLYWKGWDNSRSCFVYQKSYSSIDEFTGMHSGIWLLPISEDTANLLANSSKPAVLSYIKTHYPEVFL